MQRTVHHHAYRAVRWLATVCGGLLVITTALDHVEDVMRLALPFSVIVCLCGLIGMGNAAGEPGPWTSLDAALEEPLVVAVAIDPMNPDHLAAAGPQRLHLSSDGGRHWQQRFQLPGEGTINALAMRAELILAATSRGLYRSIDDGATWARTFRGRHEDETWCTTVALNPDHPEIIVIGTRDGALISTDAGQRWTALGAPQAAHEIVHLAWRLHAPDRLILLTPTTLFMGERSSGRWTQRFRLPSADEMESSTDASSEEPDDAEEADEDGVRLTAVAQDPGDPVTLFLAGTRGLRVSHDDGATWARCPSAGLESARLLDVIRGASLPGVYAATRRGVARYDPGAESWQVITEGRATTQVHRIAMVPDGLWAATDHGLYHLRLPSSIDGSSAPPSAAQLLARFAAEPTVGQVREAAIRYAEVSPEKIAAWRRQARYRAVLPHLSITADTSLTDFRHWDSGSNPDTLLRGERDIDWSTSLTWELGDLVWSDDQTSIDVRSKLMVQLRNDIVDEVTRLYFERRRLQLLLINHPAPRLEELASQQLRLQELTALLDGLAGGYFSSHIHTTETQREPH